MAGPLDRLVELLDAPPTAAEAHAAQIRAEVDTLDDGVLRACLVMQRLEIERLRVTCEHVAAGLVAAEEDRDALRAFARGCLDDWPDVGVDGFELQELATKTGLLEAVTVTAPCGENCNCIEYHGIDGFADGVICYRKTELLRGVNV